MKLCKRTVEACAAEADKQAAHWRKQIKDAGPVYCTDVSAAQVVYYHQQAEQAEALAASIRGLVNGGVA